MHRQAGDPVDIVITTDSTATAGDVARHVAAADPTRSIPVAEGDVLTLAVAPPTGDRLVPLQPDVPIGEAPIGSGFAASIVNYGPDYAVAGQREIVGVLVATSGALAGQEFPIAGGHVFLGREAGNDVVLPDPMVSKRHARLEVGTHIEVVDLNSANGVLVDGVAVQRVRVEEGEPFVIGGTTLVLRLARSFDGSAAEEPIIERGGGLLFNRSPRVEVRYPGTLFKIPRLPTEKIGRMFPWPILIAPILAGMALYALNGNPRSLLIIVMTPLMAFGNIINQAAQSKKGENHEILLFERQYEQLEEDFFHGKPEEERARNAEAPPVAEIFDHAMRLGPMLWTRRPEHWNFLGLRLGSCRLPARNSIDDAESPEGLPDFIDRVDRLRDRYAFVDDVPVFETLVDAGSIGIAGPQGPVADTMRGIAVQLFGLHAPNDVVVVAFADSAWTPELDWLKWMPHTSSDKSPFRDLALADSAPTSASLLSTLEEYVLRAAAAGGGGEPRGPFKEDWNPLLYGTDVARAASEHKSTPALSVIVFVSSDAPVDRGRLTDVLERGADHGVHAVFVSPTVESLPAVCRSYVDVTAGLEDAQVGLVRNGENYEHVRVEGVSNAYMEMLARRLAPVVDASTGVHDSSDIPTSVMFLQLVDPAIAEDPQVVIERWRQNNTIVDRSSNPRPRLKKAGTLRAIIGQGPSNAMVLDLRTQGPHALVGGTTGAGKSEFLQAWVLGMAAEYSPDRVTFLFVDYKGGSAFADCVSLPHTVGLVTDLSPHLVRRALTSLRAELHHREHLLNRKKVKDLLELEKRGDPDSPPALVLVIDEFAALVGEVPEFVDGVVDIAQRGRSLGIHLIMATQRPAGVIKDNLRANTNLRIALRMADESDSQDVVGIKDAAHFDPAIPGRGVAKTGPGRLAQFQSGYAGGWTSREPERADIEVAELRFGGEIRWEDARAAEKVDATAELGPTDQQRLVSSIVSASTAAGIPAPRRPWLDELAGLYDLGRLPQRTDSELLLGVSDVPERQQQLPAYFRPDVDGHLSIYGTGGSGKSAVLRTLASAAAITPRGGPVIVYGLDFGSGSLRMLESLPHVGSIIAGDDSERIIRLFRMLKDELEDRGPRFAEADASSIVEYRRLANRPQEPRILLLIDGFPNFRNDFEIPAGRSIWYDVFKDILSDGRQLGMHIALTADRAGAVPASIGSSIQRKVVLRLADDGYGMLDVPSDILGATSPAGRAIVDGLETQIAILGGTASVSEQATATRALADAMTRAGVRPAIPIGSLPKEYATTELPHRVGELPALGVSDIDLGPLGFDPTGTFLVAGPPSSGRSNAVHALAESTRRFDPDARLYYLGNARSPLSQAVPWTQSATSVDEIAALAKNLAAAMSDDDTDGRIVVVIESIGDFLQTPADGAIVELARAAKRSDHLVIAEAEMSAWGSSWPLMGEFKNARRGLLLQPDTVDGDIILKTTLPRVNKSEFPAGRGMYIAKGKSARVQLPLMD
ncbi:MAG: FtsK/SpoIIIE domain-containing protein [Lacisediminihabitans sp.]